MDVSHDMYRVRNARLTRGTTGLTEMPGMNMKKRQVEFSA